MYDSMILLGFGGNQSSHKTSDINIIITKKGLSPFLSFHILDFSNQTFWNIASKALND